MPLPPIFVIALPEREQACRQHLDSFGLQYNVFPAISGKAWNLTSPHPFLRDHNDWAPPYGNGDRPAFYVGAGVTGLMCSYLALIRVCLAMELPEVLILEDDVVLCDNFPAEYEAFRAQLPADYFLAHLGSAQRYCWSVRPISTRVALGSACCSEAILYSRQALKVINERGRLYAPYDVFLIDDVENQQPIHLAHPYKLARQRSADGEIPTTLS